MSCLRAQRRTINHWAIFIYMKRAEKEMATCLDLPPPSRYLRDPAPGVSEGSAHCRVGECNLISQRDRSGRGEATRSCHVRTVPAMRPDLLGDGSSECGYDFFLRLSFPFFFFAIERTLDIRAPAIPRASARARLIDGKKRDAFCRLTEHPARKVRPNDSFERSARAVRCARACFSCV